LGVPEARESTAARGVVALKEPVSDAALGQAVLAFFAPFTSHEPDALDGILSRSARLLDSHGASSYAVVRDELLRRITSFNRAGVGAVQVDSVERYNFGDLGETSAHPRPPEMKKGDILARVHITLPRTSSERLFADTVVLLFRWEEGEEGRGNARLRVAGFDEEEAR
jgi:hypothetical protein